MCDNLYKNEQWKAACSTDQNLCSQDEKSSFRHSLVQAEGKARVKEIWDLVTAVVCPLEERVWQISFRRELHVPLWTERSTRIKSFKLTRTEMWERL